MEALLYAIIGALNIVCFMLGAKVGQTVAKGEKVEMPTINPLKIVREHNNRKQVEMEQDKFETILRNIECYDGTGKGQEDVGR